MTDAWNLASGRLPTGFFQVSVKELTDKLVAFQEAT